MSEELRALTYYRRKFSSTAQALRTSRTVHAKELELERRRCQEATVELADLRRRVSEAHAELGHLTRGEYAAEGSRPLNSHARRRIENVLALLQ